MSRPDDVSIPVLYTSTPRTDASRVEHAFGLGIDYDDDVIK